MPPLPHQFSQLRGGPRRPFLLTGAGLSWGLVPVPSELLTKEMTSAEHLLGCKSTSINPAANNALYEWAEQMVEALTAAGRPNPKLELAEALGLTTAAKWNAKTGLPLRGTTPRHRVIARLARERRWTSMWSFNWDAHIENAFEKVGFDRGDPTVMQPWTVAYRTVIETDDFIYLDQDNTFCILKPHGCVRSLIEAKEYLARGELLRSKQLADRLMITTTDLEEERDNPTDKRFFVELKSRLTKSPMMVVGWSISEPYLAEVINDAIEGTLNRNKVEELTIADLCFNKTGHKQAAACYALNEDQVFVQLEAKHDGFGTDALFLWIQAQYALDRISEHSSAAIKPIIDQFANALKPDALNHPLLAFADNFLPAWVRLCWRANLVPCAGFQPHQLRLELQDFHVPWHLIGLVRSDLAAAGYLLSLLIADASNWNFELFPGALWEEKTGRLVIPIPAWSAKPDLRALVPTFTEIKQFKGFISSVFILPLKTEPGAPSPTVETMLFLKDTVASMMSVPKFATAANIGELATLVP